MRASVALATVLATAPVAANAEGDAVTLGKELYVERCVLCHGSQGHGWDWTQKVMRPPVPVPNLVETLPKRDDTFLRRVILDGGPAVGQTPFMPAFRFRMNDTEVDALIAYLRAVTAAGRAQ